MTDPLFETWDGEDTTVEADLTRVLRKHGLSVEGLSEKTVSIFIEKTLGALQDAKGNTSEFTTSMFILYKQLELTNGTVKSRTRRGYERV